MVPADDENTDNPAATSDINTKEHNSGCLTRMLDWLMKWWIPFGLAGLLLIICTPIAFLWGGQFHWPSANGITVCLTIAGAGLAFSSWQQRIEDNAKEEDQRAQEQRELEAQREERERNRLKQVERDEYWKRREQAYALLSSNNPNIRLGAIELLIELGDIANKSNVENTAKTHEFLQHIVTTLCNQVRYEGLSIDADGTLEQHAYLQGQIIQKLLKRADNSPMNNGSNGWTTCTIDLSDSILNIEIQIHNTTIKQPLIRLFRVECGWRRLGLLR